MQQKPLDLARIFELEPHGPDTYVGESPHYDWGRIYGGLVVAQALWAATQTVDRRFAAHSLHAYFILGGDLGEPVRYEVDRVRNGRSFTTRRVVARQSGGAILTLACSFQVEETGPETQANEFPADVPEPEALEAEWDAGLVRAVVDVPEAPPRSRIWTKFANPLGDDPRLLACALAYLTDMNAVGAVYASHPQAKDDDEGFMGASLDHAVWFHRPVPADDWILVDMLGHGMLRTRGLATGMLFDRHGTHAATVAQEALLRGPLRMPDAQPGDS
jgi:acyl-CoA thioesterase-2